MCIFLCAGFTLSAQDWIGQAGTKLNQGDTAAAMLFYERAVYEADRNQELASRALLAKALVYKQMSQFDMVLKTVSRASVYTVDDSLNYYLRYEAALAYFMSDDFNKADNYLKQIVYLTKNKELARNSLVLHILTYNELQKWDEAQNLYREWLTWHSMDTSLVAIYDNVKSLKFKNPKLAFQLQQFLPGVGYWYVGDFWKGFFSLGLQSAALTYAVVSGLNAYYIAAVFTGMGSIYLLNRGSALEVENISEKSNKDQLHRTLNPQYDYIFEEN